MKTGEIAANKTIALVGNSNVGKSALFTSLTGDYQEISNFPGTTVEVTSGKWQDFTLVDTPGVYGLSAFSEEEKVVRDVVLNSALVINVVNAVNLDRDLFLTRQLIDAGIPIIVVLNCMDECEKLKIDIDAAYLEELLGVPVTGLVAVENKGVESLKTRLFRDTGKTGTLQAYISGITEKYMEEHGIERAAALFILEGDAELAGRYSVEPGNYRDRFYRSRHEEVNKIVDSVVRENDKQDTLREKLGKWTLNPWTGFLILAFVLWGLYEVVGVLFAQKIVGLTEDVLMGEYYQPAVKQLVEHYINPGSTVEVMLTGQFGILTMAVTYVFGLLLPLVLGFFLVLSLLEDSGYLPRIAILLDRATSYVGLNGRAIIPLILGFGCVTMASITTRILDSRRERRIAIFLLSLAVPCSAQLAFITAMLARMGPGYLFLYVIIIFSVLAGVGALMSRLLPGYTSPLMIDLPPMRLPRGINVIKKTWNRTYHFIKEAIPLFAGGAVLLSVFQISGFLTAIQDVMQPLTSGWLGLPKESASAFVMGFIRRDFGTAGMMSLSMPLVQQFVAIVTMTLFVPCIATTMVIFKELGWKEALLIWPSVFVVAFIIGGVLNNLLKLFQGPWILFLTGTVVLAVLVLMIILTRGNQKKEKLY